MKRRDLKKHISLICADLLTECLAVQQAHPNIPKADIDNVVSSILLMEEDFISRVCHVDKRQVKSFFTQLEEDFSVSTNQIIDHIFHLV